MLEMYLQWVVVCGFPLKTVGSFTELWRAVEWADAVERLRGLRCEVVKRESITRS